MENFILLLECRLRKKRMACRFDERFIANFRVRVKDACVEPDFNPAGG
jgi:hypothetical protein